MSFCAKPVRIATVLSFCLIMFVGCSTLRTSGKNNNSLPTGNAATAATATYFVELHPAFGKSLRYAGQITKPTTIQNALEESGAFDKVKSMNVDLVRNLPGGGPPLKLAVEMKSGKQVKFEQDYALHPNDRIIVRQKTSSPIDKVVDSLMGG